MGPATARHARHPSLWQRTLTAGHEALGASSEVIAVEVDAVAERMITTLERRDAARAAAQAHDGVPDSPWLLDEIEVSFGVQITGEASIAVFSASSESSAQITLRFTRVVPQPTP
jgi:hypothetical protein